MTAVAFIARWFIGLTFLSSALEKLEDMEQTGRSLTAYGIFPHQHARPLALSLTSWEAVLAVLLLAGLLPQVASALALVTYVGFACLMAYRLWRKSDRIRCGCGGIFGDREVTWTLVVRSVFLSGLAGMGAASAIPWPKDWLPMILITLGLAALVWLYSTLTETLEMALRMQRRSV